MKFAACPSCKVQYPLSRLGATAAVGRSYTVACSVCGTQFELTFRKRWLRPIRTVTHEHKL